jgi:peptide/nickel transport system permease protein
MTRFVVRRLFSMVLVLFAISVVTFLIFQVIPNGDPAQRMAGRLSTPETVAAIRRTWGFDDPIWQQYLTTMKKIFTGEVVSYTQQVNVVHEIWKDLPATLSLAIGAGIIWLALGVVFGVLSALHAGHFTDRALTVAALVGVSTPVFLLGAVALYFLAFKVQLFPNGGYVPLSQDPIQWLYHMILPWLVLSVLFIGIYSRVLRSNMLDTMNEDFVRTARAKGAPERQVITSHVLRNALLPVVTMLGMDIGIALGGAIFTESVYQLPGLGQTAIIGISNQDLAIVQGVIVFATVAIIIFNLIVDLLYAWIDPRIRLT